MRALLVVSMLGVVVAYAAAPTRNLEREIVLTPHAGAAEADEEIRRWQQRVAATPDQADAYERLGWAFIAKARISSDPGYFKLANLAGEVMEARLGGTPASRLLRGHALHNLHRFAAAETIADQLVAERGSAADFGLLGDVLLEQGRVEAATRALQEMVNRQPGTQAYARIAQVRWLKGDSEGARAALADAYRAAAPNDSETRAWLLVKLATVHMQRGTLGAALACARQADEALPDFAPAVAARGRALWHSGERAAAIPFLSRAIDLDPTPEHQWWLADALREIGRVADAAAVERALLARGEAADRRTFALYLAARGSEPARALRLAREELIERADVFTHAAMAAALSANGEHRVAGESMRTALREGTRDARLMLHAAEIALALGDADGAREHFQIARAMAATLTPGERARLDRLQPTAANAPLTPLASTLSP